MKPTSSLFALRVFSAMIGFLGGMLSWTFFEIFLHAKDTWEIWKEVDESMWFGICVGAGMFLTISWKPLLYKRELGLIFGHSWKILVGMLAGFVAFQEHVMTFFFMLPSPIDGISWAILGFFLGLWHWNQTQSFDPWKQITVGILGGIISWILVPYLNEIPLVGTLLICLVLGFVWSNLLTWIEIGKVQSYLTILNGEDAGTTYLLLKKENKIGYSSESDLILHGYSEVYPFHAKIVGEKSEFAVESGSHDTKIQINYRLVEQQSLNDGDILKLGTSLLLYSQLE